ncbi:Uncharacterized protein Rs2_44265 [Raphanus sativus]|nr:Uncharacterized protein Rs2_44265 [Raphanus sativus]
MVLNYWSDSLWGSSALGKLIVLKLRRVGATHLLQMMYEAQCGFSSFTCGSCQNENAVGVLRYSVQLTVSDGLESVLFVAFDGTMSNLINARAAEVAQLMRGDNNPEDNVSGTKEVITKPSNNVTKVPAAASGGMAALR